MPLPVQRSPVSPWLSRLRSAFIYICWLPAALWLGSWLYLIMTNRWGAFAIAPLFMITIGLSLVLGLYGVALLLWTAWRRTFDPVLAACTLLAVSVFIFAL